jgi:hypothetical protein
MITDYASLQTAIADELHRADLTAKIPQWIQFAEKRFNRKLRVRQQETAFASTALVDGAAALPTDFAEWKALWLDNDFAKKLTPQTSEFVRSRLSSADTARHFAIEGDNVICWPVTGDLQGTYYAKLPALATNDTNWLILDAPDLYFYEALTYSAPHLKNDARLPVWRMEADRIYTELTSASKAASISGGPLHVRAR